MRRPNRLKFWNYMTFDRNEVGLIRGVSGSVVKCSELDEGGNMPNGVTKEVVNVMINVNVMIVNAENVDIINAEIINP